MSLLSLLINLKPPCWQKNYYFIKEILTDPFRTVAYIHINEYYSGGKKQPKQVSQPNFKGFATLFNWSGWDNFLSRFKEGYYLKMLDVLCRCHILLYLIYIFRQKCWFVNWFCCPYSPVLPRALLQYQHTPLHPLPHRNISDGVWPKLLHCLPWKHYYRFWRIHKYYAVQK